MTNGSTPPSRASLLRAIPSIADLIESDSARLPIEHYGRARVVDALRAVASEHRQELLRRGADADVLPGDALVDAAVHRLSSAQSSRIRRVVNATGIVIHTNMGRAPLSPHAVDAVAAVAAGYSNLELDLETGKRGKRADGAEQALARLTGADAAVVVNNNAAAVLLALTVIVGAGGEVILSRGEMVEIGGSFRIPDMIQISGATLVEVGTTNRTHLRDYEEAITPNTKAILRVHASNYRIVGFTKQATLADLAALARRRGLALVDDLGSGALIDLAALGLPQEPTPRDALRDGADVVVFSGDKLLGGPQAGLIVGRDAVVGPMAKHPLYRALRADKMCLAALDATLAAYEASDPRASIPVLQMLAQSDDALMRRARRLARLLKPIPDVNAAVVRGESYAGGGALPETALPSRLVRIDTTALKPDRLADELRAADPPVIAIIRDDAVHCDVRTVRDREVGEIAGAVREAIARRALINTQ